MRKRSFAITALAVAGMVAAGTAVATATSRDDDATADATPATTTTARIERRDLVITETFDGQLEYGDTRTIDAGRSGVVTGATPIGSTVAAGQVLFSIDLEPTVLLSGSIPAFRALDRDSDDGPDVTQLEQALVDLGFGESITVDEEFTSNTANAVEAWEESLGRVDPDGQVELGDVQFAAGSVRVAEHDAEIGDQVQSGSPVTTVSSVVKIVNLDFDAGRTGLLSVGAPVGLTLPDDVDTTGTIASIGAEITGDTSADAAQAAPGAQAEAETVAVTITIDDPNAAAAFDSGDVEITLERSRTENVLAVPTTALLALAEGGYAVEVVDASQPRGSRLVAVETGTYADGWVEVNGQGIDDGLEVVAGQ